MILYFIALCLFLDHTYAFMYLDIFLIRNTVFGSFHSVTLC